MKSLTFRYYLYSFSMGLWFAGPILVPFFTRHIGINQLQIQILQAFFMVVMTIIMVPTGVFADHYGRKKSVILGCIVGGLAGIWYGLSTNFLMLIVIETLFAFHQSFISGADQALLTNHLKSSNRESQLSAIFSTAFIAHMLGLSVANPIGRYIANFGLNWPIILTFIPMFLGAIIIATFPESKGNGHHHSWIESSKRGISYLIRHPKYGRSTISSILASVAAYFVIWLYVPVLEYKTDSLNAISIAFGAIIAGEIAIAILFRRLSHTNQQRFLALSRWLILIGFLTVTIHQAWITFVIFVIGAGSFGLSLWGLFLAHIQQHLPADDTAAIISGAETIRLVLLIVFNLAVGWLALDQPQPALILLTILAALAVIIKPRSGV